MNKIRQIYNQRHSRAQKIFYLMRFQILIRIQKYSFTIYAKQVYYALNPICHQHITTPLQNKMQQQYTHTLDIDKFRDNKSWRPVKQQSDSPTKIKSTLQFQLPQIKCPVYQNKQLSPHKNFNRHKRSVLCYDVSDFSPKQLRNRSVSMNKYLSSKVDFFNEKNQHRLEIKKRKKMKDLGLIKDTDTGIYRAPSVKQTKVEPTLIKLLDSYLVKRSEHYNKSQEYYVVGRDSGHEDLIADN